VAKTKHSMILQIVFYEDSVAPRFARGREDLSALRSVVCAVALLFSRSRIQRALPTNLKSASWTIPQVQHAIF